MEIKEIVSYFLNQNSNTLEVSFRTIEDGDNVCRTDNIEYYLAEEYGYILESNSFMFFDGDDGYDETKVEINENELILFLNEYYEVNPRWIPDSYFY